MLKLSIHGSQNVGKTEVRKGNIENNVNFVIVGELNLN